MTGPLSSALRAVLDREHQWAVGLTQVGYSVPPGSDPKDWRTYVSPLLLRLMDEAQQAGVWEPRP